MTSIEWNETYKPGQAVTLTEDNGSKTKTHTRSNAWDLGCGEPVVMVDGKSGGYSLKRIEAREPEYGPEAREKEIRGICKECQEAWK